MQVHGALGTVVPGEARTRTDAGGRSDIDDAAAALAAHHGHHRLRHVIDRFHIDGVDLVELGFAHLQQRPVAMGPARIVDHDVEAAMARQRALDAVGYVMPYGHVAGDRQRVRPDRGRDRLGAGRIDIEQHHLGALARKGARNLGAETRCRAGHQRDLGRETHEPSRPDPRRPS
jgi:hypothetical protein